MNHSVIKLADPAAIEAKAGIMSAINNTNDAIPEGCSVHVYQSKAPPLDWRPIPSAGVVLTGPTEAVTAKEYDAIATALIADLADNPDEARRIGWLQKKGSVITYKDRRVYMRGRL